MMPVLSAQALSVVRSGQQVLKDVLLQHPAR